MLDQEAMNRLLEKIGALVEMKAKQMAPIDMGQLRASIQHRIEGNKVIVYSDLEYAQDMEYGTPPGILDANEKEDLKEWAKRHGLPAGPVIRKIEKEGLFPYGSKDLILATNPRFAYGTFRPFLRPALLQSIPDIKQLIKSELT
jgi:hypothetical protein